MVRKEHVMNYEDYEKGKKLVDAGQITFNVALVATFLLARCDAELKSLQRAFPTEFAEMMRWQISVMPRKASRNYMQQLEDWAALHGE